MARYIAMARPVHCGLVAALTLMAGLPSHADEASDRTAIQAAAEALGKAFGKRDAASIAALMTPDVILMDPNLAPLKGPTAPSQALRLAVANQIEVVTKEIQIYGDIAVRTAVIRQTLSNNTATHDAALEVWKRDGGQWKLHRHMSTGLLSPSQILRRPTPSDPRLHPPATAPAGKT